MADSVQPQLSDEVTINKDAGRWNFVFVTLRLEHGDELPCMVDTGSPITVFDKSLESKLGMRLKTGTMWMGSTKQKCGVYGHDWEKVYLPECVWAGETYTNLNIQIHDHANMLGLTFLARHLVTLDFPKQTIYLKQTSAGPLADEK